MRSAHHLANKRTLRTSQEGRFYQLAPVRKLAVVHFATGGGQRVDPLTNRSAASSVGGHFNGDNAQTADIGFVPGTRHSLASPSGARRPSGPGDERVRIAAKNFRAAVLTAFWRFLIHFRRVRSGSAVGRRRKLPASLLGPTCSFEEMEMRTAYDFAPLCRSMMCCRRKENMKRWIKRAGATALAAVLALGLAFQPIAAAADPASSASVPPAGQYASPPAGAEEQGLTYDDRAQQSDRGHADQYSHWAAQYCVDKRTNTAAGAAIGGVLGAVLGSGIAGRGAHVGGAIAGGAVGATAGAAIGASSTQGVPARVRGGPRSARLLLRQRPLPRRGRLRSRLVSTVGLGRWAVGLSPLPLLVLGPPAGLAARGLGLSLWALVTRWAGRCFAIRPRHQSRAETAARPATPRRRRSTSP